MGYGWRTNVKKSENIFINYFLKLIIILSKKMICANCIALAVYQPYPMQDSDMKNTGTW
jgi:hypothetical protein